MQRIPLRRGTSVAIDGKSYVIGDVIGEGGFSYIYATEPGSGTDVVIKEYYPASGALRGGRSASSPHRDRRRFSSRIWRSSRARASPG